MTGIIPSFLIRKEHPLTAVQEMLVVEDMHERKQAMFDRADAFVALPGGVGTLEELVEQLTWAQLNRHTKPILIADIGGFWRPLLALLAHMRIEGFIREGFEARYLVAERIEDVLPMLRAAAERRQPSPGHRTRSPHATCDVGAQGAPSIGIIFAILAPSSQAQAYAHDRAEENHDEMDPGLGARRSAMRLYRRAGAGAERGARGSHAHETQAEDSRERVHSHRGGDERAQGRSRPAPGD